MHLSGNGAIVCCRKAQALQGYAVMQTLKEGRNISVKKKRDGQRTALTVCVCVYVHLSTYRTEDLGVISMSPLGGCVTKRGHLLGLLLPNALNHVKIMI